MAARTISPNAADQPQTVPPLSCRKAWGDSGGPRGRQPPRARAGLGEGPAQGLEPCAAPGLAPGLAPPRPGVSCLARSMALGRPCSPRWPRGPARSRGFSRDGPGSPHDGAAAEESSPPRTLHVCISRMFAGQEKKRAPSSSCFETVPGAFLPSATCAGSTATPKPGNPLACSRVAGFSNASPQRPAPPSAERPRPGNLTPARCGGGHVTVPAPRPGEGTPQPEHGTGEPGTNMGQASPEHGTSEPGT